MPQERIDELVAVNLLAPIRLTRAIVPGMVERGRGRIVNVGSIASHVPVRGESAYTATKSGLAGFGESLRSELAGTGVGVTLVSPGVVRTRFFERRGTPYRRSSPRPIPAGRVGWEIVRAVERERDDVFVPGWLVDPGPPARGVARALPAAGRPLRVALPARFRNRPIRSIWLGCPPRSPSARSSPHRLRPGARCIVAAGAPLVFLALHVAMLLHTLDASRTQELAEHTYLDPYVQTLIGVLGTDLLTFAGLRGGGRDAGPSRLPVLLWVLPTLIGVFGYAIGAPHIPQPIGSGWSIYESAPHWYSNAWLGSAIDVALCLAVALPFLSRPRRPSRGRPAAVDVLALLAVAVVVAITLRTTQIVNNYLPATAVLASVCVYAFLARTSRPWPLGPAARRPRHRRDARHGPVEFPAAARGAAGRPRSPNRSSHRWRRPCRC